MTNVAMVVLESLYSTYFATKEHVRRLPVVIVRAWRALDVQYGAWSALRSSSPDHDFVSIAFYSKSSFRKLGSVHDCES
jgi:hypothetical protein